MSETDISTVNPEQERTRFKKEEFLTNLESMRGLITQVCTATGISRATAYHWQKTDKIFRKRVLEIQRFKPEMLEDRLYGVALSGDVPALKYLIGRNDKKKKRKKSENAVHIYHHTDNKVGKNCNEPLSLEDQLYEIARKRKEDAEK